MDINKALVSGDGASDIFLSRTRFFYMMPFDTKWSREVRIGVQFLS